MGSTWTRRILKLAVHIVTARLYKAKKVSLFTVELRDTERDRAVFSSRIGYMFVRLNLRLKV